MTNVMYKIKICSVYNDNSGKEVEGDEYAIINDVEYNFIKKCLNNEYGIGFEFDELDVETNQVVNTFNIETLDRSDKND